MRGRVLIIAGSDSSGGAGIQADIKTVTALGGYAMTAITALTAQNTKGVSGIFDVPADFVAAQISSVLSDIGVDAIKLGMLHRADIIEAVRKAIDDAAVAVPVIVDPVMVAKGGASLLEHEAIWALKQRLIPIATVLTPNIPEAEVITGMTITNDEDAARAATMLATFGPKAVLLKGGHMEGPTITDRLLHGENTVEVFESPRIPGPHTHGTGCTLASAIAAGLAQGLDVRAAVVRARRFVQEAIRSAPGYGKGHGPINHCHTVRPFGTAP